MTDIVIRKDGKWYYHNAEMFRRNIVHILAANLHKIEGGSYEIIMGQESSPVEVEDVPFYATGIQETESGLLKLVFHDLQEYDLNKEIPLYFKGDVPYITYRWEADTRLSRGVYWKLSEYFVFRGDEVFIVPPGAARANNT